MELYEQYIRGELNKEPVRVALDAVHNAKAVFAETSEQKATYGKEYSIFRKLLSASDRRTPLSEIIDCIDKVIVDADKKILVKWSI